MYKGKRGMDAGGAFLIFLSIAVVMLLAIGPYFFIKSPAKLEAATPKEITQAQGEQRLLRTCFTYEDPVTRRIYPGIIDENKFNNQEIKSCFSDDVAASIKLIGEGIDMTVTTGNTLPPTRTSYPATLAKKDGTKVPVIAEVAYG